MFDPDSIGKRLQADAARVEEYGIDPHDDEMLDESLLAEGSYYIVSLRYVVAVQGAVWPSDRGDATYARDATVRLADLQHQWLGSVRSHGDLVATLREVDQINAWTEGYASVPPSLDHFAKFDALVEAAMQSISARPAK